MINKLIVLFYEKALYRLPNKPEQPWFSIEYTEIEKAVTLGMLKQPIIESGSTHNKVVVKIVELTSQIIFSLPQSYDTLSPVALSTGITQL